MACHLLEEDNTTVFVDHQTLSTLLKHVSRNMTWRAHFSSSLELEITSDTGMSCIMSLDNISIFFQTVYVLVWVGHLYMCQL